MIRPAPIWGSAGCYAVVVGAILRVIRAQPAVVVTLQTIVIPLSACALPEDSVLSQLSLGVSIAGSGANQRSRLERIEEKPKFCMSVMQNQILGIPLREAISVHGTLFFEAEGCCA